MVIARIPRYAETEIDRLCAAAGALCQKVDEDESGWDRLIEFKERKFSGSPDVWPARSSAYIQVKSVAAGVKTCRIKLSNALRAAQSPEPWFIVLFHGNKADNFKLYIIHVWADFIERSLKAARQAHIDGKLLHKETILVKFKSDDEPNCNIVEWMQFEIDKIGESYTNSKQKLVKNLGYEEGHGIVSMTLEANSEDEIFQNFLGLGSGVTCKSFHFFSSRFGIKSATPEVSLSGGIVRFEPISSGEIEIRLRGVKAERPLLINGKVYPIELPTSTGNGKIIRISSDFLEIILGPGEKSNLKMSIKDDTKYDMSSIEMYSKVYYWFSMGAISLQLWNSGKRSLEANVILKSRGADIDWSVVGSLISLLKKFSVGMSVKVSLNEISSAMGLKTFWEISNAGNLRIDFYPTEDAPNEPFLNLSYWVCLNVGDYQFCAIIEWSVIADRTLSDSKRSIIAQNPKFLDSYVLRGHFEDARSLISSDYSKNYEEDFGPTLCLGNLLDFIEASNKQDKACSL